LIACSGLFGLTSLAVTRRTKEISIRKAFGASIPRIMKLISIEFQVLVVIGNTLAWPFAYFAAKSWLQNFAYKINISPFPFIVAGIITFIIASVTVSFQTIKAARQNPVHTLRYE
ncbi:ABC transporter permease, partial [candidate division KSB1 bacterium]